MEGLDTIELFIDENDKDNGIEAISLVEYPAIEEKTTLTDNLNLVTCFKSSKMEARVCVLVVELNKVCIFCT